MIVGEAIADLARLSLRATQSVHCAKAGGEKPTGSNRAVLPIPPFWSEARLAIRAAPEIRFVIPRQLRIALRELSPIASLCARPHTVLGPRKCLVETDPPRPTRLRRSKRRVRCNRESSCGQMQTGYPFTSSSPPLRHFSYGIMQMSWHPGGGSRRISPSCRSYCPGLTKETIWERVC